MDDFETIEITVGEVNLPPVLDAIGNRSIDEGVELAFTASSTDLDSPANTLTYSLDAGAPSGAAIDPNSGVFRWTPNEAQGPGSFNVTVRVTDDGTPNLDDFETIEITVGEVNLPPVLDALGNQSIDEGVSLAFTASASDPDTPANTLTFSLDAGAPSGATIDSLTGEFTWTPTEAQGPGSYNITVRVTDDGAPNLDDFETIEITVGEPNLPPVLGAIGNQSIDEGVELAFIANSTDPDTPATTLTYSLDAGAPVGASINPNSGLFSWTPTEAHGPGTYNVTVRVTDDGTPSLDDFETIEIMVGEVNLPPMLEAVGNQSIDEGVGLAFTANASDPNTPANTLTFSLDAGAPTGASIDSLTGEFTWTPTEAQGPGTYNVTVRVTDDGTPSLDDFETIEITIGEVNLPPMLGAVGNQSVDEGVALAFTANASDPDTPANTLTYSLDAGAPVGASINPNSGLFSWTPTEAHGPGTYDITVRVNDDGTPSLDDFETIEITVGEVNLPPVLVALGNQTINEGVELAFTANASDSDTPANTLTFSLDAGAPSGASIDPITGEFTWTPTEAQGPGTYDLTVRVIDDGTPNLDDFETIEITVGEVNLSPELATIGNQSVDEGAELAFTASAADPDAPVNTLTYSLDAGAPAGASIDSLTGEFSWTPTEAQGPGVYNVTVRVTDDGTPNLDDFEPIEITVGEVNLSPELATIGNQSVDEGAELAFTASAADPDAPVNTLTYSLDAGAPAGASIDSLTGEFTWTPSDVQAPGTYNVTVRVTDDGTPNLDDFETIEIVVREVNQPPVLASVDNASVDEGVVFTFAATATDPDTPGNQLTYSLDAGAPIGASIDPNSGVFTWTPSEAQGPGIFDLTVRVTDAGSPNLDDVETFKISVNEVNQSPMLVSIGDKLVDEEVELTFTAGATDPDTPANELTFSLDASAPTGASIDPNSGIFTWTPIEAQGPGTFNVTIRVTDVGTPNLDDFETIEITVGEINLPPVLDAIGHQLIDEGVELAFTASATDPDTPANKLTYSLDAGAPAGASIDSLTGDFSWTPIEEQGPGIYNVTVRVTDDGTPNLDDFETIEIVVMPLLDYGDAPRREQSGFANEYPVTRDQNGARHHASSLFLGQLFDAELEGRPDFNAVGDDLHKGDDEDGVRFMTTLVAGNEPTKASFEVVSTEAGKLDAWIDFNRDGDWLDANEQLFSASFDLNAGSNLVPFTIPAGASVGETYARFRLSSTGSLQPTGEASDGEVEDYRVAIVDGSSSADAFVDLAIGNVTATVENGDFVVRSNDMEVFRAPGNALNKIQFMGTDGNDDVGLGNITRDFEDVIPIVFDGGDGIDQLRLMARDQLLDFTSAGPHQLQNLERVDIVGASPNALIIDGQSVINSTDADNRLIVVHDEDDTVVYQGEGWEVVTPIFVNEIFRHVVINDGARVEILNTLPWQNPLNIYDVGFDGNVTALDALQIINQLSRSSSALLPPYQSNSQFHLYFDVNGDNRTTAFDALLVINQRARQRNSSQEGEQVLPAPMSIALPNPKDRDEPFEHSILDGIHAQPLIPKQPAAAQQTGASGVPIASNVPSKALNSELVDELFSDLGDTFLESELNS